MNASCPIYVGGLAIPLPLLLAAATLLGVFIQLVFNRLVLSRKDQNDDNQKQFENSRTLIGDSSAQAADFQASIGRALKKSTPSADDVLALMKAGAIYFATQRAMAQAVLDGRVSENSRKHDFVPKIVEALEKSLPAYYAALQNICKKVGIPFTGEFSEENYENMFEVVDRYDHAAWIRVRALVTKAAS